MFNSPVVIPSKLRRCSNAIHIACFIISCHGVCVLRTSLRVKICIAIKRIYVHEKIIDEFRDAMVRYTKTLKLGEGNEEGVFLGPIQNKMQYDRVQGFFDDAKKEKMNIAVGGVNPSGKGYYITPTIVDRPAEDSRLVLEEPFGKPNMYSCIDEIRILT